MLSLKKAASTEGGWSFSEMTTIRRLDESSSTPERYDKPTKPPYDAARAQNEFSMRQAEVPDELLTDASEGIGMTSIEISEEPVIGDSMEVCAY